MAASRAAAWMILATLAEAAWLAFLAWLAARG
jgi:hypothetical protein